MKSIPLVDLKAQFQGIKPEVMPAIESVLDGMNLFLGENVYHLERDFAEMCHAKYGVGVGSGTEALFLALTACGIGVGDEVITVPNTFFATVEAIVLTGARPVFVDIDPGTYTMDPSQIEDVVGPRTKAVIPVHLYGQPADMGPIKRVASKYGLKIIEDACQAHGATYDDRRTGSLGDVAAFSFYYSKNLGAYGEGGIITTKNRAIATHMQMLRNHGSSQRYYHTYYGTNSRLDEIQAAILRVKLPYLEQWSTRRRALALEYSQRLKDIPEVQTPVEREGSSHVYHLYVIQVPDRDDLQAWLKRHGVQTGIHYPVPIHLQPACAHMGYSEGSFPVAEAAADRILSLPIYPELAIEDVAYICQTIKDYYGKRSGSKRRMLTVVKGDQS